MLLVNYIRESKSKVIQNLNKRGKSFEKNIAELLDLDDFRRAEKTKLDKLLAEVNQASKEIGKLYSSGNIQEAEKSKENISKIKSQIKTVEEKLSEIETKFHETLTSIPNIPHDIVPAGKSEEDNELIKTGEKPAIQDKEALPHWEFAEKHNLISFELGNKITGSGFPVYLGKGAALQRGLISFFLDEAIDAGYDEVIPPLLVNEASGFGTGQLPDKEGQMYHATEDNFYLIPTAEVPITNIFRDVIVSADDFPIKKVGYTPCFRREAGSYGKDVRGLNRVHQFDKVEIVQVVHPEKSYAALDEMVAHVEGLLIKLELPYRIVKLCGGDLGFTSALTYDFEVYSSAQDKWLEVSSVSNFETYQANRLKLRFKNDAKKNIFAHTLNGSALALPRIVAALIENNQKDGVLHIPKALENHMRFSTIG